MPQGDIAGKEHWDGVYGARGAARQAHWQPRYYGEKVLERALLGEIGRLMPRTILEVGCGDSLWLPYLARQTGASVAGMDYSERGCELARRRLREQGLEERVWCADLFRAKPEEVGQYDFVYSLGLVEHFSDLEGVLSALLKFVRPGGALFTEVPNLRSIHGLMVWAWQPVLFDKHELISRRRLVRAYERLGLEGVRGQYLGVFSLGIVAWDVYARWPRLVPHVAPRVAWLNAHLDPFLERVGSFRGISPLAPYVFAIGKKQDA